MKKTLRVALAAAPLLISMSSVSAKPHEVLLKCSMWEVQSKEPTEISLVFNETSRSAEVGGMNFENVEFSAAQIKAAKRGTTPFGPGVFMTWSFSLNRITGRLSFSNTFDIGDVPHATDEQTAAITKIADTFHSFLGKCEKVAPQF